MEVRILRVFCVRERGDTELTEVGSECRVLKKDRSGVCAGGAVRERKSQCQEVRRHMDNKIP